MDEISITFGALATKISEQLDKQGLGGSLEQRAAWQRDCDAITRLAVRGLLTETQTVQARKKLLRRIAEAVSR